MIWWILSAIWLSIGVGIFVTCILMEYPRSIGNILYLAWWCLTWPIWVALACFLHIIDDDRMAP